MKKILTGLVLAFVLLIPTLSFAQSEPLTDQFAQIAQNDCVDLKNNMSYRSRDARTNNEVSLLQNFLIDQGYLSGESTGYYGTATRSAVRKFQSTAKLAGAKNLGFGSVGPKSRAEIKKMTCSGATTATTPTTTEATLVDQATTTITSLVATSSLSTVTPVSTQTDMEIFVACYRLQTATTPSCAKADFNGDGRINTLDLGLLKRAFKYDMSGDKIVDLTDSTTNKDLAFLAACLGVNTETTPLCTKADFNVDGRINALDIGLFKSAIQYDLNGDIKVDLNMVVPPAITVTSTPTFALSYDSAGKEASLVSNYTVKITARETALSFPAHAVNGGGGAPVHIRLVNSTTGVDGPSSMLAYGPATIPAGTSAEYKVKLTANPNQLFAGVYYAIIEPVVLPLDPTNSWQISVPAVNFGSISKTNTLTVIGERAPYISSVTSDASGAVTVKGARFDYIGNSIIIDGSKTLGASKGDATFIWFNAIDSGLASGQHYLQITNATTGNSNTVYFTVAGATTTAPTITVLSTPVLQLGYDHAQKESTLIANFSVDIKAGSEPFMLLKPGHNWSVGWTSLYINSISSDTSYRSAKTNSTSPIFVSQIVTINAIDIGDAWQVPAGQTSTFKVTQTFKPSEMFAGEYTAFLLSDTLQSYAKASGTNLVPSNKTNAVTIIGETSPYISSITSDAIGMITINGARLFSSGDVKVFANIDGISIALDPLPSVSSIVFKASNYSLANGQHYVQITNATTGNSNTVYFTVGAVSLAPTLAFTASPTSITLGQTSTYTWSSTSATDCVFSSGKIAGTNGFIVSHVLITEPVGLTCTGPGGSVTKSVTVIVNPVAPIPSPTITITSPNGGEVLTVGQTYRIKWNATSTIDTVTIGYSFGTGSLNWFVGNAANNIPNVGYYDWNVNIGNTSNTQVKISIIGYHTGVGSWTDLSDNFFTVSLALIQTDLEIFTACYGLKTATTPSCIKADFNSDGYINTLDLGLFKSSVKYDMSGDSIVDLVASTTNKDLAFLTTCFGLKTATTSSCTKADFNVDGIINTLDLGLFKSAIKFDLNGDIKVDLTGIAVATSTALSVAEVSPRSRQTASIIGAFSTGSAPTPVVAVSTTTWGYLWTRNLEVGSTYTNDVTALQTALTKEGVYSREVTGGFYTQTYGDVKVFQTKYGIESTGFVGPVTRAKLNSLYPVGI